MIQTLTSLQPKRKEEPLTLFIPHDGSMGRTVYLPTNLLVPNKSQLDVGKYTSPMDPMGIYQFFFSKTPF